MDIYDENKKVYDIIADSWKNIRTKPFDFVINFAKNVKNKIIADLGCGVGTQILAFDKSNLFICLDFSKNMIKIAMKNLKNNYKCYFVLADIKYLPFKQKSFDIVLSIATLHHLKREDLPKVLKEIKNLAKEKVLISFWKRSFNHLFALILGFLKFKKFGYALVKWKYKGKKYYRIYYLYTKKELEKILKKEFKNYKIFEDEKNIIIEL